MSGLLEKAGAGIKEMEQPAENKGRYQPGNRLKYQPRSRGMGDFQLNEQVVGDEHHGAQYGGLGRVDGRVLYEGEEN